MARRLASQTRLQHLASLPGPRSEFGAGEFFTPGWGSSEPSPLAFPISLEISEDNLVDQTYYKIPLTFSNTPVQLYPNVSSTQILLQLPLAFDVPMSNFKCQISNAVDVTSAFCVLTSHFSLVFGQPHGRALQPHSPPEARAFGDGASTIRPPPTDVGIRHRRVRL